MPTYDRVLIQPTRVDLERALHEAVTAANRRGQQRLLSWPPADQPGVLARLEAAPEGHHQWNGGEGEGRSSQQSRSVVVLAWWTDLVGRKHCRVVGRRGRFNRHLLHNLLGPPEEGSRPALWLVYPDYVFLQRHQGRRVAVALCPCGSYGTPEELGWMGTCCAPCHDRHEDGRESAPAWPDPRRSTLSVHHDHLVGLAYSPDGATVLGVGSGYHQGSVTLWDAATGQERLRLGETGDEDLLCAAFAPDGASVWTGSAAGTVQRWELPAGEGKAVFAVTGPVHNLALSPDGALVACGASGRVTLWEARGQLRRDWRGDLGDATCVAFGPDGKTLAAGNRAGTLRLWDVVTGRGQAELARPGAVITGLAFAPDGRTLAAALEPPLARGGHAVNESCAVLLVDVPGGQVRSALPGHPGGTFCVAFAPDGRRLATGGNDHTVKLWDLPAGRERVTLEWHTDTVWAVAFCPDGQTLATGSFDGKAKLWPGEVLRPV
jgi:WD40 repeat protein